MAIIEDDGDLLPAIYDGPFETPMWQTLLAGLRRQTGAEGASLTIDGTSGGPTRLHSGTPTLLALEGLREERVYAASELPTAGTPGTAGGVAGDNLAIRVTEAGGTSATIALTRTRRRFAAPDGALLRRIAPHLRRALRAYAEIERQKAGSAMVADVMARLDFGWLRVDARATVIDSSSEARRLLRHGAGLKITSRGQLIAEEPAVGRRLSAALRAVIDGRSGEPRAINVSQEPWVDLLLMPAGDHATIYIQGDRRSLADRHEQLAELFGLLPSEARLALALSRGMTIAEAADALGLTTETARNYSKKIYAKMGARGQSDVVRYILTSVLALA